MATNSVVKSHHGTLTTTTEDIVKLTQFWDGIEIENRHATEPLYVRFGGTAAVAAGAGTDVIRPASTKLFNSGHISGGGIVGSTSTPPHWVSLIGNTNPYAVSGVARVV